jgi:hypothetical protein
MGSHKKNWAPTSKSVRKLKVIKNELMISIDPEVDAIPRAG